MRFLSPLLLGSLALVCAACSGSTAPTTGDSQDDTAAKGGLVQAFKISVKKEADDAKLKALDDLVVSKMSDGNENATLHSVVLELGADGFTRDHLKTLLSGRYSQKTDELDLTISDAEAAKVSKQKFTDPLPPGNDGMIVDTLTALRCVSDPKKEKLLQKQAADFFMPVSSGQEASDEGMPDWTDALLGQVRTAVKTLAGDCRFQVSLIHLQVSDDDNLSLLAIARPDDREILLLGFEADP